MSSARSCSATNSSEWLNPRRSSPGNPTIKSIAGTIPFCFKRCAPRANCFRRVGRFMIWSARGLVLCRPISNHENPAAANSAANSASIVSARISLMISRRRSEFSLLIFFNRCLSPGWALREGSSRYSSLTR